DPSGLAEAVVASGVDGFLVPLQARAYGALARELEARGVRFIHFLEHDPQLRDVQAAAERSSGYLMLQANPGPTGIKPVVLPDSGSVIGMLRTLGVTTPIALGIGIGNPEQARAAVDKALSTFTGDVAAIGICSQVNTHVFVDADGRPLRPAILWQDQRCGGSSLPGRAEWVRSEEPTVWEATRWILSPKDFVTSR